MTGLQTLLDLPHPVLHFTPIFKVEQTKVMNPPGFYRIRVSVFSRFMTFYIINQVTPVLQLKGGLVQVVACYVLNMIRSPEMDIYIKRHSAAVLLLQCHMEFLALYIPLRTKWDIHTNGLLYFQNMQRVCNAAKNNNLRGSFPSMVNHLRFII